MLFNIKKVREDNKDFELLHYLFFKKDTEQKIIGYVCLPKVRYLPFKYGIYCFGGGIKDYTSYIKTNMIIKVNLTEIAEALKDTTIIHVFCGPKHWIKHQMKKALTVINIKQFFLIMLKRPNIIEIYIKIYEIFNKLYSKWVNKSSLINRKRKYFQKRRIISSV
jgi:hypothetical protein